MLINNDVHFVLGSGYSQSWENQAHELSVLQKLYALHMLHDLQELTAFRDTEIFTFITGTFVYKSISSNVKLTITRMGVKRLYCFLTVWDFFFSYIFILLAA